MLGLLSGGFATLNRPAKFGFFLTEKSGDAGRAPFQAPLRLRGGAWVVWRATLQLRGDGLVWGGRSYGYAVGCREFIFLDGVCKNGLEMLYL